MNETEFEELVAQTSGPQRGRRIFHAIWGGILAAVVAYGPFSKFQLVSLFAAVFVGVLTLDLVRLKVPRANALFFRALRWFVSPREKSQVASSTWYVLGALLVVAAFDAPTALSAILVLALADPAASYVGRRWGRRALGTGSVLGVGVFAVVASCVLLAFHPWPVAVGVAAVVALIECQEFGLDDNLTVPVATALALTCVYWLWL